MLLLRVCCDVVSGKRKKVAIGVRRGFKYFLEQSARKLARLEREFVRIIQVISQAFR